MLASPLKIQVSKIDFQPSLKNLFILLNVKGRCLYLSPSLMTLQESLLSSFQKVEAWQRGVILYPSDYLVISTHDLALFSKRSFIGKQVVIILSEDRWYQRWHEYIKFGYKLRAIRKDSYYVFPHLSKPICVLENSVPAYKAYMTRQSCKMPGWRVNWVMKFKVWVKVALRIPSLWVIKP